MPLSDDDGTSRVLPGTWVFHHKCRPDHGEIKKFKSRYYCCCGDLEEGKFDTCTPAVAFPTIIVSALKMGWKTQWIDFFNAFVQSDLD